MDEMDRHLREQDAYWRRVGGHPPAWQNDAHTDAAFEAAAEEQDELERLAEDEAARARSSSRVSDGIAPTPRRVAE